MSVRWWLLATFYTVAFLGLMLIMMLVMTRFIAHWQLPIQTDFQLHILKNDTISGVANHLFQQNYIHHTFFLEAVFMTNSTSEHISPGMYTIHEGMSYLDLVSILQVEA